MRLCRVFEVVYAAFGVKSDRQHGVQVNQELVLCGGDNGRATGQIGFDELAGVPALSIHQKASSTGSTMRRLGFCVRSLAGSRGFEQEAQAVDCPCPTRM